MEIQNILIVIGVIALLVLEVILEVSILSFLGALIRKIFMGKKQSIKEIYSSNTRLNTIVGMLTLFISMFILLGTIALINN